MSKLDSNSKETDHGEILQFLCWAGLPDDTKDDAVIKDNGYVTIKTWKMLFSVLWKEAVLYINTPEKTVPVSEAADFSKNIPAKTPVFSEVTPSSTSTASTIGSSRRRSGIREIRLRSDKTVPVRVGA